MHPAWPDPHPALLRWLNTLGRAWQAPLPDSPRAWNALLEEARKHGLAPLLYASLREAQGADVPGAVLDELKTEAMARAATNLWLAEELRAMLEALERAQLPCLVMRGLPLAQRLYGDISRRPMGDIDLLVRKTDLTGLTRALEGLGYRFCDRRPGFAQEFSYTLECFRHEPAPIVVEPHWSIAYPPFVDRISMEGVWQRSAAQRVGDGEVRTLGDEDTVLNLCFHAMHRGASAPLLWFYELSLLIERERETLDWDGMASMARESGAGEIIACMLGRVRKLFGVEAPVGYAASESGRPHSAAQTVLLHAGIESRESLAAVFAVRGMRAKWRYAVALLCPSPEFMRLHYGLSRPWQVWLRYPQRIAALGAQATAGLARSFTGSLTRRSSLSAAAPAKNSPAPAARE